MSVRVDGTAQPAAGELGSPEKCMACGHLCSDHDPIASRFCDATVERALTRGCVCRGVKH
jgi:hypothetical protein